MNERNWCLYAEAQRDQRELQEHIKADRFPLAVWVWIAIGNVAFWGTLAYLFARWK